MPCLERMCMVLDDTSIPLFANSLGLDSQKYMQNNRHYNKENEDILNNFEEEENHLLKDSSIEFMIGCH